MRSRQIMKALAFGIAALLFAWAGLSLPIHFRSVSPLILREAAEGTASAESLAGDYLDTGLVGPAKLILDALPSSRSHQDLALTIAAMEAANPSLATYGSSASDLRDFLGADSTDPDGSADIVTILLHRERRAALKAALRESNKPTVKFLLRTTTLQGYETFLPVSSNAGQPLEAIILLSALLSEKAVWADAIDRDLLDLSTAALKDPSKIQPLEKSYTALLTLASRTNWAQLTALVKRLPDLDALHSIHTATQLAKEHFPQLYTASLLSGKPAAVATYATERGDAAWPIMELANSMGEGAVLAMLDFFQPLYTPPTYLQFSVLEKTQQRLKNYTGRHPTLAKILKGSALGLAGFCLTLSLAALLSFGLKAHPRIRGGRLIHLFHATAAAGFAALIWILSEPALLDFAPNEKGQLRIQLASVLPEDPSAETTSTMLDQVTILVLLLFLVLQGTVFVFGLLKIREIQLNEAAPALKLRLLDNEENLFDLGLYVGLGGTVSSLVMVVLEFIDASLMAAYASTLFGIVFVAILKIAFLRPFRRHLIVAADAHAPSR